MYNIYIGPLLWAAAFYISVKGIGELYSIHVHITKQNQERSTIMNEIKKGEKNANIH